MAIVDFDIFLFTGLSDTAAGILKTGSSISGFNIILKFLSVSLHKF